MELRGGKRGRLRDDPAGRKLGLVRCIVDAPAPGPWNMALDEALMASASSGGVTLRFYQWRPGCLSLGRNQTARGRYDRAAAKDRGIDVVRRPTGGRAVYHDREVTYSVTAPEGQWGSLQEAYRRINRALACGLGGLGIAVTVSKRRGERRAPRPVVRACFREPLPGEVMAGGRKLVGSAQCRHGGALLQHGSILIHNDQHVVDELRTNGRRQAQAVPAACLEELLPVVPPTRVLIEAIAKGFAEDLGALRLPGAYTAAELARARQLSERYVDDVWTWRR